MGLDLEEHRNCFSLDQTPYIKLLDTVNLKDENLCIDDPLQSTTGGHANEKIDLPLLNFLNKFYWNYFIYLISLMFLMQQFPF